MELERDNIKTDRKSNWCIYVNERGLYYINIMTGDMRQADDPPAVLKTDINRKLYINRKQSPSFLVLARDEWDDEWDDVLDYYTRIGSGQARRIAVEEGTEERTKVHVQSEIGAGAVGFVAFSDTDKAIHLLRDANKPGWLIIALDASSPYIDTDDKVREEREQAKRRLLDRSYWEWAAPSAWGGKEAETLWELLPRESKKFVEEQERHFSPRLQLRHAQKKLALAKGLHEYRDTIPQEIIDKIGEYI